MNETKVEWIVYKENELKSINKVQLMLTREVNYPVAKMSGTVYNHSQFASMIENQLDTFVYHGHRNFNCFVISKENKRILI